MKPPTLIRIFLLVSSLSFLSACENSGSVSGFLACQDLEGDEFYSAALYENDDGEFVHSKVAFNDDNILVEHQGETAEGEYECDTEAVTADFSGVSEKTVLMNEDDTRFEFNPPQADTTLTFFAPVPGTDVSCDSLIGNNYVAETLTIQSDPGQAVSADKPFFHFQENSQVDYTLSGDQIKRGIYDCTLGVLHVHAESDDSDPMVIDVLQENQLILVNVNGTDEYFATQDQVVCTAQFDPVCAVNLLSVDCETEPCPIGRYKTYSNECRANADGALLYSEGECGGLEDESYYDASACDGVQDTPVCAAAQTSEPCAVVPCPSIEYNTFENECEAKSNSAMILSEGVCGDLEGLAVNELEGGCAAVYNPVCAKDTTSCIAGVCNFGYQTFANECQAQLALATPMIPGECDVIGNAVANASPPVRATETLPETSKTPVVQSASIENNVLNITVSYAACNEQHFNFFVDSDLGVAANAQASWRLIPLEEDMCQAQFSTTFSYDLLPLEELYFDAFGEETGDIELPNLGTYTF